MRALLSRMRLPLRVCGTGLLLASLVGCWSSYEINRLAIVTLIGVDLTDNGDFKITASIVLPAGTAEPAPGGGKLQTSVILASSTGKGMYDSLRKLSNALPKKIYWSHLQAIVIGEDVAKKKMLPVLDVMKRQHEFRDNVKILVSRGKAEKILGLKPLLQGTLGAEVNGIVQFSQKTAMTLVNDLNHFSQDISSPTKDHITGEISPSFEKGVEFSKNGKSSSAVSIRGIAVFKQNSFIGWMNREETRGVLFLTNKIRGGIMELPCSKNDSDTVSVQLLNAVTQKTPRIVNGEPVLNVNIRAEADIDEVTCPDFQITASQIEKWNTVLEEEIRTNVEHALQKGQKEWGTDIFLFGDAIYKKYPRVWKKLQPTWREEGLRNLKVNLNVYANIRRYGLIMDPLRADNQGG